MERLKYISGLNGVRAFAVIFVIIAHRFPQDHQVQVLPLGSMGVDIFFVLSGFLITRILFFYGMKSDSLNWAILRAFYWRRILRIFPIYYLTMLFLYLTKSVIGNNFEENIWWYLTYTSNFLIYYNEKWFGALAHLWSLAVEEQYYLFWPFLVLFIGRMRWLLLILILIILGTGYSYLFNEFSKVLTVNCLNTFGLGGLLAYVEIQRPRWSTIFFKILPFLAAFALIGFLNNYFNETWNKFPVRFVTSVIAVYIISVCLTKPKSILVGLLENRVLYFLGLISYGIYLYHNLVPRYWRYTLMKFNIDAPSVRYEFNYTEFVIQTLFIVFISYLSWIIIEKPILRLKSKYQYSTK
ncbi:acyltransferase family protein [Croceiramulus getboli]